MEKELASYACPKYGTNIYQQILFWYKEGPSSVRDTQMWNYPTQLVVSFLSLEHPIKTETTRLNENLSTH